jgi:hypothetical protein
MIFIIIYNSSISLSTTMSYNRNFTKLNLSSPVFVPKGTRDEITQQQLFLALGAGYVFSHEEMHEYVSDFIKNMGDIPSENSIQPWHLAVNDLEIAIIDAEENELLFLQIWKSIDDGRQEPTFSC